MQLTDREQLVLACLINGDTDKIIAWKTGISIHVVRTHLVKSILRKLGAHNRTQAAIWGWKHGIGSA